MQANTSYNYFGKKADMSLYPEKKMDLPQEMGFGLGAAMVVAGPLKGSQNYARVLLFRRGQKKEDLMFGTTILSDFSSGNIMFPMQISQAFSANSLRAINWLKSNYEATEPEDERVKTAKLISFSVNGETSISFEIELTMVSKEKLLFLLPVSF